MNKLMEGLIKLVGDLKETGLSDEKVMELLRKTKDKALTSEDLEIFEKIGGQERR